MSFFRSLLMAAAKEEVFTLKIQVAANQTWSFNYYCNNSGSLDILDWGDGTAATYTASGTASHNYITAGTYIIKMVGNLYRAAFGSPNTATDNSNAVIDCNGNWKALGNLTSFIYGFSCCTNFVGASLHSLPENLENALSMFYGCASMASILTALPATLASATGAFWNCTAAINLTRLPPGLVNASRMFSDAVNLTADLDTLSANAPAGGWASLTNISNMFTRCTGVTGSKSAFLAKCPNVTASDYWAYGTSTTE